VCQPVDQFGNPVNQAVESGSGYWWPRIAITFIALAALLTFLSTRLVVPAGMRWAFRRRPTAMVAAGPTPVGAVGDPAEATVEDVGEMEP